MDQTTRYHLLLGAKNEWIYISTPPYALMAWTETVPHVYPPPNRFNLMAGLECIYCLTQLSGGYIYIYIIYNL